MLPRRRFSKSDTPNVGPLVYYSYAQANAARAATRPKVRHLLASLFGGTVTTVVAFVVADAFALGGDFPVRIAEVCAFLVGAAIVMPLVRGARGQEWAKTEPRDRS